MAIDIRGQHVDVGIEDSSDKKIGIANKMRGSIKTDPSTTAKGNKT